MKKYQKEIIKLTAIETLQTLVDFVAAFHGASSIYRKDYYHYLKERNIDKGEVREKIYYLAKYGYIESVFENRQRIYQITKKGINHLVEEEFKPEIPDHWDGFWVVLIFDIPEKLKRIRNLLRRKILHYGFIHVQKSVYVYPFECEQDILSLVEELKIEKYVTMIRASVLQGEKIFAEKFIKRGILKREYFKNLS